jgi:hypothetical protein
VNNRFCLFWLCTVCLLSLFCPPAQALGEKERDYMVGFRSLSSTGEKSELLNLAVWYPSGRDKRDDYSIKLGFWEIRAERNARPASGRFPIILLSHEMAGHYLANHDLCSALAAAGFVVIAPLHQGDNFRNANAIFSAASHLHRPQQLLAALNRVKNESELSGRLDLDRIGLLGCGSGAATVLQLAGVGLNTTFDQPAHLQYCAGPLAEPAFCSRWARTRFASFANDVREITGKYGARAFNPELPGLRAVGLLAPGGTFLLDRGELAALSVPLAAVFAGEEEIYHRPQNDTELREMFPDPLDGLLSSTTIKDIDHFSFNAPCPGNSNEPGGPREWAELPSGLCGQAGAELRAGSGQQRNYYFISFFRASLGLPLPAE